jgi:hypothetical protein
MANYKITRTVPRDPADEFAHDKLFSTDRKHNALDVHPRMSGGNVVTVSDDDDQMIDAVRAAGADLLGGQYGYARAGYVRRALRPASRAEGRSARR